MLNPLKTVAIKSFLTKNTHPDLAALYSHDMECQVNVGQDGGEKIVGDWKGKIWNGWTDGLTTWKPIRIPRNANTTPEFLDTPIKYDLAKHVEGIGMTGWDWVAKLSRWVAFDFDAITGHSDKHSKGLTTEQLDEIKIKAEAVPWITVRKSTGGRGLHFYVFFHSPVHTINHNEHAALGRSILGKLSGLTGISFETKVDICGQNMWVWHRKMLTSDGGLSLIKDGSKLTEVPINWRDHIKVISGQRKRSLPRFINDISPENEADKSFSELSGQTTQVPLGPEHLKLINYLEEKKTASWWDPDHHMLVTHTWHLKSAHHDLGLKGLYDTLSPGTDLDTNNCYLFPLRGGGWTVRRYSLGVQEAATWDQDGRGWTRTYYNSDPDLASASKSRGAVESPTRGFVFKEALLACETAVSLGAVVPEIPLALHRRQATLKEHKDGRLLIEIDGKDSSVTAIDGWLLEKGDKFRRLFNVRSSGPLEPESFLYDDVVRHVVTESGEDSGWLIFSDGNWRNEPIIHVRIALKSMDKSGIEIDQALGAAVMKAWKLVNRPFQPEFPGNREWNRDAAQFKIPPSQEVENLRYPTWLSILNHCGEGLNDALKSNPWAVVNGVTLGSDYLKIWCASLFKESTEPLPYLFFYGPQNSGKSIFHEALSLLLNKGYQRADSALTNQQGFNGELRNAIICVIEEIDLKKSGVASNRVKDWVTARELPIHAKGQTPYHVPNTTHWIQCANSAAFCPTFPGDTRITMVHVGPLDPLEMVPKKELVQRLMKEAPDFLAALLLVELPPSNDRLNVPIITTSEKSETERLNRTPLEDFIAEKVWDAPGEMVTIREFYDKFIENTESSESQQWTKQRISREMPAEYPRGRDKNGAHCYGNMSLSKPSNAGNKRLIPIQNEKGVIYLRPEGWTPESSTPRGGTDMGGGD